MEVWCLEVRLVGVGFGKSKERRGVEDGGEREATLIICARNESCGKRVTLNVNRERRSV